MYVTRKNPFVRLGPIGSSKEMTLGGEWGPAGDLWHIAAGVVGTGLNMPERNFIIINMASFKPAPAL